MRLKANHSLSDKKRWGILPLSMLLLHSGKSKVTSNGIVSVMAQLLCWAVCRRIKHWVIAGNTMHLLLLEWDSPATPYYRDVTQVGCDTIKCTMHANKVAVVIIIGGSSCG